MLRGSLPDVFLDTDVAFDIISKRTPHFASSVFLLQLAAKGAIRLLIAESSIPNLIYLTHDIYKISNGSLLLLDFIRASAVVHAGKETVIRALNSEFSDKEDAIQYYTALHANADYFVTRNKKDYKKSVSSLPVYSPAEFAKL
jgi:predicted nucleic acid-binding protein